MRWVICGAIYGPNYLIVFIDILSGPKEFVPLAFLIISILYGCVPRNSYLSPLEYFACLAFSYRQLVNVRITPPDPPTGPSPLEESLVNRSLTAPVSVAPQLTIPTGSTVSKAADKSVLIFSKLPFVDIFFMLKEIICHQEFFILNVHYLHQLFYSAKHNVSRLVHHSVSQGY